MAELWPRLNDGSRFHLINCVNKASRARLEALLREWGVHVITLHGESVKDKRSFFEQAAADLPQPPDMIARDNWDALNDNLWSALPDGPAPVVAIIWTHTENMLEGGLITLLHAVDVLATLSRDIPRARRGPAWNLSMKIFLIGSGPNFSMTL